MTERTASEEWRYLRAAFAVVGCLALAETGGWLVYRAVHEGPTALELTELMHLADGRPVQYSIGVFAPGSIDVHVMRGLKAT